MTPPPVVPPTACPEQFLGLEDAKALMGYFYFYNRSKNDTKYQFVSSLVY
jgi:hypothetical protein